MQTKIFTFIILNLIFIACTKEVNIKYPEFKSKLVVNSIFSPDSTIKINLSQTKSIYDTVKKLINNAQIFLFDGENYLSGFVNTNKGNYVSNIIPIEKKQYHLIIQSDDFETVYSYSYVPKAVNISNAFFYIDSMISADGSNELISIQNINFTINDPSDVENYYEIFFHENDIYNYQYINYYSFAYIDEPVILTEGDLDYEPTSLFFCDKMFNGQNYVMHIKMQGYACIEDNLKGINSCLYIELRSVSKEYFLYRKYWTRHLFNQNTDEHFEDPLTLLFLGEPLPMYTNIENGYGIFAGYSSTIKEVEFINNK